MRFISYMREGRSHVGMVDKDEVGFREVETADGDLLSVIENWMRAKDAVPAIGRTMDIADIDLLPPVAFPRRNIFCVGKNYREHAEEFSRSGFDGLQQQDEAIPEHPIFFTKPASSLIPSGAHIDPHQTLTNALDYEAEIGVIMGRGGRNINEKEASKYIWGYTLINDVTARDLQKDHKQWFLGKSLDTFCPMGPWAVTADEVEGPLTIECRVNGELRQKATTDDLIFSIPHLISTLSAGITLQPGDIIATGTPVGVGIGYDPPRFLQSGDVVTITSPGFGTLSNMVG